MFCGFHCGRRAAVFFVVFVMACPVARSSSSMWSMVPMAPADPILGVAVAFNADPSPQKVNLGIGAYRTSEGETTFHSQPEARRLSQTGRFSSHSLASKQARPTTRVGAVASRATPPVLLHFRCAPCAQESDWYLRLSRRSRPTLRRHCSARTRSIFLYRSVSLQNTKTR